MGEATEAKTDKIEEGPQTLALELTFPAGRRSLLDSDDCLGWLASVAMVCLESDIELKIFLNGERVEVKRLRLRRNENIAFA